MAEINAEQRRRLFTIPIFQNKGENAVRRILSNLCVLPFLWGNFRIMTFRQ